jgi:chromosome segregation ATPase
MIEEANIAGSQVEHHELLNDIQVLSNDLESLYTHYSNRIRNVSEELSRERSKHKVYQLEIAENHHTIQMLTEQIDYLLQDIEVKHELYLQVQHQLNVDSVPTEVPLIDPAMDERSNRYPDNDNHEGIMPEKDTPILATSIPEIRVIYESIPSEEKSYLEKLKNEVILLLMEANEYFLTESQVSTEIELYQHAFYVHIGWLQMEKHRLMVLKRERWHNKVWKFLWGKEEGNNHPEIIKKLDLIEDQLVSYSTKFNEVKDSLQQSKERGETTQDYLKKMTALYDELKKIEGYYEEKLHGLRSQVEECKQRENDLERQVDLLNEKYSGKQKEKSQREVELEKELAILRKDIQSQSNKKNDLYNKMKQQSSTNKQSSQVNPQFDEYGSIPMSSDSKRTMFNPNKYMR